MTTSSNTIDYNSVVDNEKFLRETKKMFDLERARENLKMDQDDVLIRKVRSLMDLLEATEPIEYEDGKTVDIEKYPLRSLFSEKNKDIIREKLFKLIQKY